MLSYLVWALLLFAVVALAFRLGEWEERLTAVVLLVIGLSGPFIQLGAKSPYAVEWPGAIGDVIFFSLVAYLAVRRRLTWAIWVAGFQGLAFFIHAAVLLDGGIRRPAYIAAYNKYGYLVLAAFAVGIWTRRPKT